MLNVFIHPYNSNGGGLLQTTFSAIHIHSILTDVSSALACPAARKCRIRSSLSTLRFPALCPPKSDHVRPLKARMSMRMRMIFPPPPPVTQCGLNNPSNTRSTQNHRSSNLFRSFGAGTCREIQSSWFSLMYSHSPFWWRNIGSAFIRMKSSTSLPSILTGRRTRTCLPLTKIVMNSCRRFLRACFSAGVSFRLGFPIRRHSNLIAMPTCIY